MPAFDGVWHLLEPIKADMELVQSGCMVRGMYKNSEVEGTIVGTLAQEGEDDILVGKWADQLGAGDFKVAFGKVSPSGGLDGTNRISFTGNWRHSRSESWDGIFEGVKS